jgi:flavin reductase (DIM6/NTAB) family NADH-FMN oxidoreductase RutF
MAEILIDGREFRNTLSHFGSGVVIVTGMLSGVPAGFSAQSFSSLSLDPPLVLLCPARTSTSWPKLRQSGRFCVNILAEDQRSVCDVFAKTGIDKFTALTWRKGITGSPVLDGVLAYIDCDLYAEHDGGDHTIVVGKVVDIAILDRTRGPLIFFRGGYGRFDAL